MPATLSPRNRREGPSALPIPPRADHVRTSRHSATGTLWTAAARPDQRVVLCAAQSRARGHFRNAQHHQFCAWRHLHDGRICGLVPAAVPRGGLLAGARDRTAGDRTVRHDHRALDAAVAIQARPPLRAVADVRPCPDHPGAIQAPVRLVGPALPNSGSSPGRAAAALHVPAELPCLGDRFLVRRLPRNLVPDRAHQARLLPARRDREPDDGARVRHQCAANDHADLWRGRRPRGARRCVGGADLPGQPADGRRSHRGRVRRGGDRRHGLDHGVRHHRVRARRGRRPDQGVLPGSLEHRDLRGDGDRPPDQADRPVRQGDHASGRRRARRVGDRRGREPDRHYRVPGHGRTADRGAILRLPAVPDEGAVLCAVRLRAQPDAGLRRSAVVRTCHVPRQCRLRQRPCGESVGPHAGAGDHRRHRRRRAARPCDRESSRSAARASISP